MNVSVVIPMTDSEKLITVTCHAQEINHKHAEADGLSRSTEQVSNVLQVYRTSSLLLIGP